MDVRTGELFTEGDLAAMDAFLREEKEKYLVRIEGSPEAIAEVSSKVAAQSHLDNLREEARKRAFRKMR